jgi:hypothetical protein
MGNYNPYLPYIAGESWVPIREENLVYNQIINNVEIGTSFTTEASTSVAEGRFYVSERPPQLIRNQVFTMAIYPKGAEERSGPIQSVVIPCNNGGVTGTGAVLTNASSVAQAVFDASDRRYINVTLGNNQLDISLFFNVYAYREALAGKRILGVNFLYSGELVTPALDDNGQRLSLELFIQNTLGSSPYEFPPLISGNNPTLTSPSTFQPGVINRIAFGDTNVFFSPTSGVNVTTAMPWGLQDLLRFEATWVTLPRLEVHLFGAAIAGTGPVWTLDYAALEVIYCEEQRIAVGCSVFGAGGSTTAKQYTVGANTVTMRSINQVNPVVLAANTEYTLTLAQSNVGDSPLLFTVDRIGPQPKINALRELYPMPAQPGMQVNIPGPPTPTIDGQVFTVEPTPVLPQLSLHIVNGDTVPAVHSYGRQSVGQVWGSDFITQKIEATGQAASYPWVRFYARRFGDTTVPLTFSYDGGNGQYVAITPDEFDVLDEIIDGWKEVTLRYEDSDPNVMPATTTLNYRWSANSEVVGNRWEILGASAPAISAIVGNPFSVATTLGPATYGWPTEGTTVHEGWIPQSAPPISGTGNLLFENPDSDAVVLFSQDPAPITGFALTQLNFPLSGIGLNCGLVPAFIPSALAYNRLSWGLDGTNQLYDTFNRTVASGWGVATSGQTWANSGGSASDFSVNGTSGNVLLSTTNAYRITQEGTASQIMANVNAYVEISSNQIATVTDHWGSLTLRNDGSNNHLYGEIDFLADRTVKLTLTTVVSAVHTVLGSLIFERKYVPGTKVKMRLEVIGANFKGKAWMDGFDEPDDWLLQVATPTNLAAGRVGTRSIMGSGGTTTVTISYYNMLVSEASLGYTEIQRMDELETWQTIMKATNQSVSVFNDYEARVGVLSTYRIRKVNIYGFEGLWSSSISNEIAAPGVTATGLSVTDHVWIFTTNSVQNGTSNLAYALGWEGEVSEDFNFPESSSQVYQTMYGRDFLTVFRPEERGGTNFARNLLVQAAAISQETLEDFTSLRDMAWADVPYICLRDEAGNRWFSNVTVPSGTVLRGRRLYMAPVNIIEVTDTPTPVDP